MDKHWKPGQTNTSKKESVQLDDDILGDLLGDDDDSTLGSTPEKPSVKNTNSLEKGNIGAAKDEDFYACLGAGVDDVSDFSYSETDHNVQMAGLDDLNANLFGSGMKPLEGSGRAVSPPKSAMASRARPATAPEKKKTVSFSPPASPPKTADTVALNFPAKNSIKSGVRQQVAEKKIDFGEFDEDDPLAGLLSDDEETSVSKKKKKRVASSSRQDRTSPVVEDEGKFRPSVFSNERPPTRSGSSPVSTSVTVTAELKPQTDPVPVREAKVPGARRRDVIDFDDDDDPLGGLEDTKASNNSRKSRIAVSSGDSRPAKSALADLLGTKSESSAEAKKDFILDDKYKKKAEPEKSKLTEEDFTFGSYRPSSVPGDGSPSVGRRTERESPTLDLTSDRPPTSRGRSEDAQSETKPKSNSDWLGLGGDDDDVPVFKPPRSAQKPVTKDADSVVKDATVAKKTEAKSPISPRNRSPSKTDDWLMTSSPEKSERDLVKKRRFSVDDWLSRETETEMTIKPEVVKEEAEFSASPRTTVTSTTQLKFSRKSNVGELEGWLFDDERNTESELKLDSSLNRSQRRRRLNEQLFHSDEDAILSSGRPSTAPSSLPHQAATLMPTPKFLTESTGPPKSSMTGDQGLFSSMSHQQMTTRLPTQHGGTLLHADLETKMRTLELERNYLQSIIDMLRKQHTEEMETIQAMNRNKVEMLEESFQRREKRLRDDLDELMSQNLSRTQQVEKERADLVTGHHKRLEEREQEKLTEIQRLKDMHRLSVSDLQHEHEDTITRIRQAKEKELESVADVQSHTRSIENVISKLEDHRKDLGHLQYKVEDHSNINIQQRDLALSRKDEQLKGLEERLIKQQDDNDRERLQLQQLIGKMEAQLRDQTKQLDEERWRVKQEQSKLESLQTAADQQRRLAVEELTREKINVQESKDDILMEQKRLMADMYVERRKLAEERSKFDLEIKLKHEQLQKQAVFSSQLEAETEGRSNCIKEETVRLARLSSELQNEQKRIMSLQASVDAEKVKLEEDRRRMELSCERHRERALELDKMVVSISKSSEESKVSLSAARRIEDSHNQRLNNMQNQLVNLRDKERQIAEERVSLAKFKSEIQRARNSALCVNCRQPADSPLYAYSAPPTHHSASNHTPRYSTGVQSARITDDHKQLLSSIENEHMMRLWRIHAEKDKDFLDDERIYLEALRHTPYHKHPT